MNNRTNKILSWVSLIVIVILFYQNRLQHNAQNNIRDSILKEWEERKKIEDSIKKDIDSKRNSQEFMMKLDYQRELEEMLKTKLSGLEEENSIFKSNLDYSVNLRLSEYDARILDFNQQSDLRIKKMQEYINQQDKLRNELEADFKQRIKFLENTQKEYLSEIDNLKQEVRILFKKQIALEKQIKENNVQSQGPAANKP